MSKNAELDWDSKRKQSKWLWKKIYHWAIDDRSRNSGLTKVTSAWRIHKNALWCGGQMALCSGWHFLGKIWVHLSSYRKGLPQTTASYFECLSLSNDEIFQSWCELSPPGCWNWLLQSPNLSTVEQLQY